MAISCEAVDLITAAACFNCMTDVQKEAAKLYLLCVIAGVSPTDLSDLIDKSKCFLCLNETQKAAMQNYLLCQIVNL